MKSPTAKNMNRYNKPSVVPHKHHELREASERVIAVEELTNLSEEINLYNNADKCVGNCNQCECFDKESEQ